MLMITLQFAVVGAVLGIYAWVRAAKLSLPLNTTLPALATFLPVILTIITPLVSLLNKQQQSSTTANGPRRARAAAVAGPAVFLLALIPSLRTFLTFVDQLLTALPAILVALSTTYFTPEEIATCRLDAQWQRFWRSKDSDAIKSIQDQLKCCGYRSLQDRAWPFPDSQTEGSCTAVLGYSKSCMKPWKDAERQAAVMVFVASVLGFFLKLRQPVFNRGNLATIPAPRTPALLEAGGASEPTESDNSPFAGERYTDNEAEESLLGTDDHPDATQQARQPRNGAPAARPGPSHSTETPEEHDILHGGFREAERR
ncbi:hypothetical protein KEM52_002700 [Ascosphaera acerosa]|nr:hypothetical protein KEM52_002700 [Ascosphaera acerosa]